MVRTALGVRARTVTVATEDRETLAGMLRPHVEDKDFRVVMSLLPLAEDGAVPAGLSATATLLQALGDLGVDTPLWTVTRAAVSVAPSDAIAGTAQAAVWGLGRVAAMEHPQRWGGLIDLPAELDERVAARLAGVLTAADGEDQVAIRQGAVYGRRLTAHAGLPGEAWDPTGTVLITGGTGSLGTEVARELARAGAPHLLLLSRRGPDAPGAADLRGELEALGAAVTIVACDAADRDALSAVLDAIPAQEPLTAVVHAAGVLDDGVLDGLTPDRFEAVFRSKVTSALVLDELTRDREPAVFALFSSASAAIGNPGQANYAAANAVLDAIAERRSADGLPATAIAWGAWAGSGMAAGARAQAGAQRAGVRGLEPRLAVKALRQLVTVPAPTAVVADVEPDDFLRAYTTMRPGPLFAELPGYRATTEAGTPVQDTVPGAALRDELLGLAPQRRHDHVLTLVRGAAAAVPGPRFRLARRGRAAQPDQRGDRAGVARHAHLRPPQPGGAGRPHPDLAGARGRPRRGRRGRRRSAARAARHRVGRPVARDRRARAAAQPRHPDRHRRDPGTGRHRICRRYRRDGRGRPDPGGAERPET
jgi:NAD(P)-dependent dehydrogenase (short-subunit alcohol dehydrogenase family)